MVLKNRMCSLKWWKNKRDPLAQMVERLSYIQDVVGSNPTGVTKKKFDFKKNFVSLLRQK